MLLTILPNNQYFLLREVLDKRGLVGCPPILLLVLSLKEFFCADPNWNDYAMRNSCCLNGLAPFDIISINHLLNLSKNIIDSLPPNLNLCTIFFIYKERKKD